MTTIDYYYNPHTLRSARNLATTLSRQGKHADAERIEHEVLSTRRRVLGEEHPDTLRSARNLATTLAHQAKFSEAEEMLQATLEAYRRVLGHAHPRTLECVASLETVRSAMRAEQPTRMAGKAAARRTERAAVPSLSPTALAEAEARARAAEAELLAMLDLEEPLAGAGSGSGKGKGKVTGRASKAKGHGLTSRPLRYVTKFYAPQTKVLEEQSQDRACISMQFSMIRSPNLVLTPA